MPSHLSKEEIVELLLLDPTSSQAKKINDEALSIGKKACGGRSLVFGQIGVDDSICPENCAYCAFALRNAIHGSHKLSSSSQMMAAIKDRSKNHGSHECHPFENDGSHKLTSPIGEASKEEEKQERGNLGEQIRAKESVAGLPARDVFLQCEDAVQVASQRTSSRFSVEKRNEENHGSHKLSSSSQMMAAIISEEALVSHLQAFDEARVDAVSLMGTAALPFENYLNMIKIARDVLSCDIRIIVNYRDMVDNEISALEQAGATHVYHAVRIREGKITGISPERRRATIKRVQKSNMQLMNGVEPVWEPFDEALANDVADAILEAVSEHPQITGSCGLCSVENSTFGGKPPTKERVQLVASVLRLVAGETVPYGCVGGISWVDAGADPRERGFSDSKNSIIHEVKKARSATIKEGWKLSSSPF